MKKLNFVFPMVFKVQLFGHSFVNRLKSFIKSSPELSYSFNLPPQDFLVQYTGFPGAKVQELRANLEHVSDFEPDLLIILIGTNDLYHFDATSTATYILDLVDTLQYILHVPKVVVCQTIYRVPAIGLSRYPVNVEGFSVKVDELLKSPTR